MKRVRIVSGMIGIFLFSTWSFLFSPGPLSPASFAWAAPTLLLGERHKDRGIDCAGCHKESTPNKKPPTAVCLECHGGYAQMAERTMKLRPNPHDSHQGDLECEACHHSHKPSEDYCATCHNFGFKVP